MAILKKIMIDDCLHYSEQARTMTGRVWAAPTQHKFRVELTIHQDFGIERELGMPAGRVFVDTDAVKVGDLLWPGLLADAPATPPMGFEVLKLSRVKSANGKKVVRIAVFGTKGGGD